jgi:DNA polymerase-3 subunit epsilon
VNPSEAPGIGRRLRVAYLDTETTGLSANMDRIIEIAIVLAEVDWETGAIIQRLDHYQGLQDPGRRIPAEALAIHGITDAMVEGRRIDGSRAAALLGEADICLAHNSGFDKGFVAQVVPEARGFAWGCTCRGIPWKKLYPSLRSTALQSLSGYFGCSRGTAHRALGDVETTMNLVSLPGIQGARAFQHYILHKKIRGGGLESNVIALPDLTFMSQLIG